MPLKVDDIIAKLIFAEVYELLNSHKYEALVTDQKLISFD